MTIEKITFEEAAKICNLIWKQRACSVCSEIMLTTHPTASICSSKCRLIKFHGLKDTSPKKVLKKLDEENEKQIKKHAFGKQK